MATTKKQKIEILKGLNVELTGDESVADLDALLVEHNVSPEDEEDAPESTDDVRASGIIVKDNSFTVKELPLIVTLPKDASKAQIARAKILNAYAYSNPIGWAGRKEHLIEELEALKNAPDPVEDPNAPRLSVGGKNPGVLPA